MNTHKRQKDKTPSKAATPTTKKSFLRTEWPLLLFPALVLAALALLHIADRSIQQELSKDRRSSPVARARPSLVSRRPSHESRVTNDESRTTKTQGSSPQQTMASDRARRARALAAHRPGRSGHRRGFPGMAGSAELLTMPPAARMLASLRQAVGTQNHARIKECMRNLVALGDDAVAPLTEIIASGTDETALWAAEALARIGSPAAATALLDTLEQIKDGPYKEQLAKQASNISNHDSWPVLLDAVQETKDSTVQRAAAAALAKMADTPVIDEIVARYANAQTDEEAARLARVLGNVSTPGAGDSLRSLAGDVSSAPQDSLQQAAIEALARIGDPQSVSYLLQKLEASPPGEGGYIFNTITTIETPQAHSALLYAAAGNKEVSAEQGRTAAICALENYPSEETCRLLEQIVAAEDNTAVATAAARTLENIEKKTPAIVERTTSKADTTSMLPVHPLQK